MRGGAPLAGRQINALRTCIANSQVPGADRGRPPMLALATSVKVELDTLALVPARRAMATMRALVRNPELTQDVACMLEARRRAGHEAAAEEDSGEEDEAQRNEEGEDELWQRWDLEGSAKGPVGLLEGDRKRGRYRAGWSRPGLP